MIIRLISFVVVFTFFSFALYVGDGKKNTVNSDETSPITGTVVDNSNEPLFGVKITINGIDGEFFSDFDGNFIIPNLAKGKDYEVNVFLTSFSEKTLKLSTNNNILLVKLFPN